MDAGAAVTAPLGVTGLGVTVHLALPDGQRPDYGVMVTFDLMAFLKART